MGINATLNRNNAVKWAEKQRKQQQLQKQRNAAQKQKAE